eukprot:gene3544-3813_t
MAGRFALTGKKCLVTGGTKGIGRAILNEFVGLGAQVFICARSQADVAATITELQQQGHIVRGCASDLTDPQQRQHLLQEVTEVFEGELHVLVCNAGVNTQQPTLDYTTQDYQQIVGTNLEATYFLCQLMQPLLEKAAAAAPPTPTPTPGPQAASGSSVGPEVLGSPTQNSSGRNLRGDAAIIFVSSVAGGPLAGRSGSLYAISKAGVNQLAASLGCEWAKLGIRTIPVDGGYSKMGMW